MLGTLLCLLCAGCLSSPFFPASLYFTGTVLCPPFVISTPFYMDFFFLLPFSVDFLQLPNVNVLSTRTFVVLNIQTFHCPLIPWCLFTSFKSTCIPQYTFLNIALFSFASFFLPWLHCTNIENSRPLLGPALSG